MARRVRDTLLESRSARQKLAARNAPYWSVISPGLALGYRKGSRGGAWLARCYDEVTGRRVQDRLCATDDVIDADGTSVLNFWQAQERARAWYARTMRQLSGLDEVPAGPYTVAAAMRDYLEWMEAHRRSADDYRRQAKALILPKLGDIELTKLTAARLRQWHVDLTKVGPRKRVPKGHAPVTRPLGTDPEAQRRRRATANRVLSILKAALNFAWREGKTPSDDAWRRVRPFHRADAARTGYLSVKDARRLLDAASDEAFRDLMRAGLLTGARYGEITALTVGDYDHRNGMVRIGQSKSGKPRHIVLNEEGTALFRRLTKDRDLDEVIFLTKNGTRWYKTCQHRLMRKACARAGLKKPISFHQLRHTWASLSLMAGAPHVVVAKNLGHADTRMVEKHYGHLAQSYISDTIRRTSPRFADAPSRHRAKATVIPATTPASNQGRPMLRT